MTHGARCEGVQWSEPCPYPQDESNLRRIAPLLTDEGIRLTETPIEGDARIGAKLALDFIAKTDSKFQVIEARAGREFLNSLYGSVGLEAGLENHSLREQQVLRQRQPGGNRAILVNEQG